MNRNKIISLLNCNLKTDYLYTKLLSCLVIDNEANIKDVDKWFEGIISSLYYRPNKTVLILEGEDRDGNIEFFKDLMFDISLWGCPVIEDYNEFIYSLLILDIEFETKYINISLQDNFRVVDVPGGMCEADKRLASYCGTARNWRFPQRKNFIVLKVKSVDWITFNSIDKLDLWREIFHKFKPEGK